MDNWYSQSIQQIEEKLNTDINSGLSQKAAKSRRRLNGENKIYAESPSNLRESVKRVLLDYVNILFAIVVIIAALIERDAAYLYMLLVLLINSAVIMAVYAKSHSILYGMSRYSLPFSKVMREGRLFVVRQENIVRGDIIFISEGDIIPCDARLISSDKLCVLESNLLAVKGISQKDAKFIEYKSTTPENMKNMLFASTVVTRGSGKAIVCEIGKDTLVCEAKKNKIESFGGDLKVLAEFKKYCTGLSLLMLVLIFVLTFVDLVTAGRDMGLFNTFLTGLSLAISSMSEMFVLFGSIILGCGIFSSIHKSKNISSGALIKVPEKVEKLKDISCLVFHREGVLSIKKICVEKIFASGRIYSCDGKKLSASCEKILEYAVIASGKYGPGIISNSSIKTQRSAEDEAIISAADKFGLYNIHLDRMYPIVDHSDESIESRFDTTLTYHDGKYVAISKGECNQILDKCRYYRQGKEIVPITSATADNIRLSIYELSDASYRMIGIASKDFAFNSLSRIRSAQNELVFEGFIAIGEPILPGTAKQISKCKAAGIKTIMLTDDVDVSNVSFARSLGILNDKSEAVTGSAIYRMGDRDFIKNFNKYCVYEDLTVQQKRILIKTLRESGETVGFVGNDLGEIILEKDADVGFAQSMILSENKFGVNKIDTPYVSHAKDNCEALKFVSDVLISDASDDGAGGFNAIIGAIESSKVIYQNILRAVKYLMVSQFAKFFMVLYSVIVGANIFIPMQILFCGLLVDLAAVIIIAFEKPSLDEICVKENTEQILSKPFSNYWYTALIGLVWAVITFAAPYMFAYFGWPILEAEYGTYVFFSFIVTQIITLTEMMKEKSLFIMNIRINRVYLFVCVLIAAFMIAVTKINYLSGIFGVCSMTLQAWVCTLSVSVLMLGVYEIYKFISRKK